MTEKEVAEWLDNSLSGYVNLTSTAVNILESLLRASRIDYLAVSGRTKTADSITEKLKRKNYRDPKKQLTDLSGVRVIVYFESQVDRACKLIEKSFAVDRNNSSNRDLALSIDQMGYRSIHYVCTLGPQRENLPEHAHLATLKFEIQVRTVLQHAWAELAHDRNYKFAGKLPRHIEREVFLYAGMLEIADKGFDALSQRIDTYIDEVKAKTAKGDFDVELNSVSLEQFVESWARAAGVELNPTGDKDAGAQLVRELNAYGIHKLEELRKIIPRDYGRTSKGLLHETTIFGLLRDWMIMHDYVRYRDKAWERAWYGGDETDEERELYRRILGAEKANEIFSTFRLREED